MKSRLRILAVASSGGHWIQLLRMKDLFDGYEVMYLGVDPNYASTVPGHRYLSVTDASRWSKVKLIKQAIQTLMVVLQNRTDVIITTGASVGLWAVFWGRMFWRGKTIWIDSIANSEKMSLSGKVASYFCSHTLTQWPQLKTSKIRYIGNVI